MDTEGRLFEFSVRSSRQKSKQRAGSSVVLLLSLCQACSLNSHPQRNSMAEQFFASICLPQSCQNPNRGLAGLHKRLRADGFPRSRSHKAPRAEPSAGDPGSMWATGSLTGCKPPASTHRSDELAVGCRGRVAVTVGYDVSDVLLVVLFRLT